MKKGKSASPQLWQSLLRNVLLGTDQVSTPNDWPQTLDTYRINAEDTPSQLLELAGKTHLLAKGAASLPQWTEAIPAPPPATEGKACSWRSVQHLQLILNGHHERALPEFIRLLGQHKKRLPAESIPALLDQCTETPALWSLLQPLLGKTEYWLIRQHPHWSRLLPQLSALDDWPTGIGKEQYELLAAYRQADPEAARDSLSDHWLNLDHRAQARVLPALAVNLSPADEAFLQHCLSSKRKEVRVAAGDLLTRLPESALVEQLFLLASEVLQFQGKQLKLKLPEHIPGVSKEYGIYPTGSKMPGGLKVNWLQQVLSRIPISRWTGQWKISAFELVQLMTQTERSLPLLQALNESLMRFPEEEGQQALIRWWLLGGQEVLWNNKKAKALLPQTTADFFNQSLTKWLEQFGPLVPADTLPAYWLSTSTHPWTTQLSKIVVLGFQDVIQGRRTADWHLWHYRQIFEAAAYGSDPALLEQFRSGWSFRNNSFGRWHADLEKMLQTLHFRKEMRAALAS
ncbi:MAG: DUF5691 domain-containing protein [Bacteroidota bacterium]